MCMSAPLLCILFCVYDVLYLVLTAAVALDLFLTYIHCHMSFMLKLTVFFHRALLLVL